MRSCGTRSIASRGLRRASPSLLLDRWRFGWDAELLLRCRGCCRALCQLQLLLLPLLDDMLRAQEANDAINVVRVKLQMGPCSRKSSGHVTDSQASKTSYKDAPPNLLPRTCSPYLRQVCGRKLWKHRQRCLLHGRHAHHNLRAVCSIIICIMGQSTKEKLEVHAIQCVARCKWFQERTARHMVA